jgi:hypothetical protein
LITRKRLWAVILAVLILAAGVTIARAHSAPSGDDSGENARQGPPTAVPLQFPTPTATAGPPTETPTRTPTSLGRAVVEAISPDTNVRGGPDINENRVGQIQPGTQYPVVGKRFNWYQIEYINSPTGTAWVYFEVVTLTGDPALIPELSLEDIPTVDPAFLAQQQTAEAVANTPGAAATLTAQVLITPTGIFTVVPGEGPTLVPGAPLPTFTYPPYTPTPVAFPRTNPAPAESGGIPPLVPILALGALGLMGLLVALLRRL